MNIAILGAGMVGRTIALDLAREFSVTCFDLDEKNLQVVKQRNSSIQIQQADLQNYPQYKNWLASFDLIVSAVPGFIGFKVLEAIITCHKDIVDISFFPEDGLQLDQLAKEKNVTAIIDTGVAPGMSNLILGRYNEEMTIYNFECYVGVCRRLEENHLNTRRPSHLQTCWKNI